MKKKKKKQKQNKTKQKHRTNKENTRKQQTCHNSNTYPNSKYIWNTHTSVTIEKERRI